MNKALAVLKLLCNENLIPEGFLKVMVSVAINKAADTLSQELGYKVSADALEKECYQIVK